MSSNGTAPSNAAPTMRGSGRVLVACDSCRLRKSRCDGLRPRCSHCVQSGRTCFYRPTPAGLESDASVLARLADTEARLQALEDKNRMLLAAFPALSSPGTVAANSLATSQGQAQSLQSNQNQSQDQSQDQSQPDRQNADASDDSTLTPPDLHTAAAFQLLTRWPRLTINMTIPGHDTQTYLTRCDQADALLERAGSDDARRSLDTDDTYAPWQAILALEQLYDRNISQNLPLAIAALLEAVPLLQRDHVLASFAAIFHGRDNSQSRPVPSTDAMDADVDLVEEATMAAATQPQPFHGGRIHSPNNHHHEHQQQQQRHPAGQSPAIDYDRMSFAQLLMYSIAARVCIGSNGKDTPHRPRQRTPFDPPSDPSLMALSAHTCSLALQKLWTLQAGPAEDRVPLVLFLAHYLADFWVRPFHARGLLQSIDPAIKHMAMMQPDDPLVTLYARLHFTLESDIITELNGFCTLSSAALLAMPALETASAASTVPVSSLLHPASPPTSSAPASPDIESHQQHNALQRPPPQRPLASHVKNHVRLRILLNRILHLLYSPTRAYAQPHELADIVARLSASLRAWYQAQPPGQQFVRDATVFRIHQPSTTTTTTTMPFRLRETALRYFGCVFLLHRPVLYYFLHNDLENAARPPGHVRALHVDREPWVLESCRDCIESAALLIHLSFPTPEERGTSAGTGGGLCVEDVFGSWCGLQMLFAAYLILLQVRVVPSLRPVFRNVGDADALLDKVERAFATHPVRRSLVLDTSLAILQDERRNFAAATP
ncbi:hypothetical protein SPBR_04705 [Sporothrix brasiliensis 5110]|uniref:Zn(2)-C6 fungal-type domain-containing protein n=1 Tax=Sporothrix brasiliensis 5110 TaxID=1398154 RepID=A0A0C2IQU2_9PEZI|nr:uncharacterized protein SPBR_04705 [Sporothrix brasiliensis 5110]KIH87417.1 hypothetical protein SPBR_04705 [Sporothrix brasiliensis 5110]